MEGTNPIAQKCHQENREKTEEGLRDFQTIALGEAPRMEKTSPWTRAVNALSIIRRTDLDLAHMVVDASRERSQG